MPFQLPRWSAIERAMAVLREASFIYIAGAAALLHPILTVLERNNIKLSILGFSITSLHYPLTVAFLIGAALFYGFAAQLVQYFCPEPIRQHWPTEKTLAHLDEKARRLAEAADARAAQITTIETQRTQRIEDSLKRHLPAENQLDDQSMQRVKTVISDFFSESQVITEQIFAETKREISILSLKGLEEEAPIARLLASLSLTVVAAGCLGAVLDILIWVASKS